MIGGSGTLRQFMEVADDLHRLVVSLGNQDDEYLVFTEKNIPK